MNIEKLREEFKKEMDKQVKKKYHFKKLIININ